MSRQLPRVFVSSRQGVGKGCNILKREEELSTREAELQLGIIFADRPRDCSLPREKEAIVRAYGKV